MIGTIQVVQPAKSGNSLRVQIGGQWYSAKIDTGLTAADIGKNGTFILGDTPFPPGSTNYWINDYTFEGATSPATQAMDAAMAQQPYAPGGPSGYGDPPAGHPAAPVVLPGSQSMVDVPREERDPMVFMAFTSNAVAHAIAAGKIESPADIEKWANAAFSAAKSCVEIPY